MAYPIAREFQSAMCILNHGLGYKEVNSKGVRVCYESSPKKCLKIIGVGFSFRWRGDKYVLGASSSESTSILIGGNTNNWGSRQ